MTTESTIRISKFLLALRMVIEISNKFTDEDIENLEKIVCEMEKK